MNDLIQTQSHRLREDRVPFALATIINVRGSASARPGSKAVISREGKNLAGWVGGGCAESFICAQALEALQEQKPRIVTADLDDEIFGLGMPCGGVMDVYIEPVLPPSHLALPAEVLHSETGQIISWLANQLSLEVSSDPSRPETIQWRPFAGRSLTPTEQALLGLGQSLAFARGCSFDAMITTKDPLRQAAPSSLEKPVAKPKLWITGKGRITEELARFGAQLHWPVTIVSSVADPQLYPPRTAVINEPATGGKLQPSPDDFVIVASHHKGDPDWIEQSLKADAPYVGLIASRHRVGLVFDELRQRGLSETELRRVRGPAGLDMNCGSPAEIALSIICEILKLRDAST